MLRAGRYLQWLIACAGDALDALPSICPPRGRLSRWEVGLVVALAPHGGWLEVICSRHRTIFGHAGLTPDGGRWRTSISQTQCELLCLMKDPVMFTMLENADLKGRFRSLAGPNSNSNSSRGASARACTRCACRLRPTITWPMLSWGCMCVHNKQGAVARIVCG